MPKGFWIVTHEDWKLTIGTVISDENGKVVFNDLETNQYFMVVTKDGLSNIKDNFVIVGVFQNQGK